MTPLHRAADAPGRRLLPGSAALASLLAALVPTLAACGDPPSASPGGPEPTGPDAPPLAASLPLLGSDGVHLSAQEAYEGFDPVVTAAVAGRRAELVAAGMDSARHLVDWADLEPVPGRPDPAPLIEALEASIARGTPRQFVNVTVIDSGGPEALPPHVAALIAAGTPWDDPRILGGFRRVLDAIVPEMIPRGVYMLGVANEPGGFFEDEPRSAASFPAFVAAAVEHVRTIDPRLAVTVVFAGPEDPSIPALMPLTDVAVFNQYAYDLVPDGSCTLGGVDLPIPRATGPEAVGPMLDALVEAAGGRLVCIQEFGQSTGWDDRARTLGPLAGLGTQRRVIEALGRELAARREHVRTVSVWTLNDHTRDGMKWLVDALVVGGMPGCFAEAFAEAFGPTGLVRSDAEATPKPAFEAFRAAVRRLRRGAETGAGTAP